MLRRKPRMCTNRYSLQISPSVSSFEPTDTTPPPKRKFMKYHAHNTIYDNRVTQIVWWILVWNTAILLPTTFGAPRHVTAQLSHPSWSNSPNIFMALCLHTDTTSRNLPDFDQEKIHIQHAKSVTHGQQKQKYPHTGILKCNYGFEPRVYFINYENCLRISTVRYSKQRLRYLTVKGRQASVKFYHFTRRYIPEHSNLQTSIRLKLQPNKTNEHIYPWW